MIRDLFYNSVLMVNMHMLLNIFQFFIISDVAFVYCVVGDDSEQRAPGK